MIVTRQVSGSVRRSSMRQSFLADEQRPTSGRSTAIGQRAVSPAAKATGSVSGNAWPRTIERDVFLTISALAKTWKFSRAMSRTALVSRCRRVSKNSTRSFLVSPLLKSTVHGRRGHPARPFAGLARSNAIARAFHLARTAGTTRMNSALVAKPAANVLPVRLRSIPSILEFTRMVFSGIKQTEADKYPLKGYLAIREGDILCVPQDSATMAKHMADLVSRRPRRFQAH